MSIGRVHVTSDEAFSEGVARFVSVEGCGSKCERHDQSLGDAAPAGRA